MYKIVKENLLYKTPWSFAKESEQLTLLAGAPEVTRWAYAFLMPTVPEKIYLFRPDPVCDYEIFENKIFTNVNQLRFDYTYDVSEAAFPGYFTNAMCYSLAAELTMTITQNVQLAQLNFKKAQMHIMNAMAVGASEQPNYMIARDKLFASRYVGISRAY